MNFNPPGNNTMEDQHQNKTVNNDGITLPDHDFAGLSQVISSAKPTLPATENGFVPLKELDLVKPFDGVAEYLKNWEKRLAESPIDPANAFDKLKEEIEEREKKFNDELERRIEKIAGRYDDRREELKDYHREIVKQHERWSEEWKKRFDSMEKERDNLVEEYKNALVAYYEKRLEELGKFHVEIKNGLEDQIRDLKDREKERIQWIDERRDWLFNREGKFDEEKKDERKVFNALREQVIKNEHPLKDDIEKTAWQIFATKFHWWITVAFIVAVVVIIGCYLHWGWYPPEPGSPVFPASTSSNQSHSLKTSTESLITLDTTTNKEN